MESQQSICNTIGVSKKKKKGKLQGQKKRKRILCLKQNKQSIQGPQEGF